MSHEPGPGRGAGVSSPPYERGAGGGGRWILILASCAAMMSSLDANILRMALPALAQTFEVNSSVISWVQLVYMLVLTSFILVFGRLGDLYGYRRVFLLGITIFTLGSLWSALSWNIGLLLVGRAVQGTGGAIMIALTTPILTTCLPESERMRGIGLTATWESFGITAGRFLGGAIIEYLNWHWLFLINLPIGIFAFVVGFRVLPRTAGGGDGDRRFDHWGAALIFLTLGCLLFALSLGKEIGWDSPVILTSFGLSLLGAVVLLLVETRLPYRLLDFHLFRSVNLALAFVTSFIKYLVESGQYFLLPFYLILVRKISPDVAGLLLVVPAVLQMFVSPMTTRLLARFGSRWMSSAAMSVLILSSVACWKLEPDSGYPLLLLAIATIGISKGLFIAPNRHRIVAHSPKEMMGSVNGMLETTVRLAITLGICVFETVYAEELPVDGSATMAQLMAGFHAAFGFGVVVSIIGLLTALTSFRETTTQQDSH